MSRLLALAAATAALLLGVRAESVAASPEATSTLVSPPAETTCPGGSTPPPHSLILFNFEDAAKARWSVESDRVMGGRSSGSAQVAGGTLVFTGEVVTEGGGFSSVRAGRQADLSDYDGIELRVRGGGRTFELDVDDGTQSRGREVSRRGPVPTSGSWETVRVPFAVLEASAHGEPVNVDPMDLSTVKSIGIYIIDGKDGPFRLEVDWIRAYHEGK